MTKRWLDVLFSSRAELRPVRALLSPTWLGALAVLAVNDHLLKGAGVLPGSVTGKLSDLAGMIVAPALMAALLGVRSRRGLLHCHIAVGLVFALINLSPACADAWSWLMGLVGFPWHITVDPTDLLALPALALGWRALVPAMRADAQPVSWTSSLRWQSVAHASALCVGTFFCVATSENRPPNGDGGWDGGEPFYQPITADVYLHNANTDLEITVRVRELKPDVFVDCLNIASDPGVLFSDALFGEGVTWAIPPGANVPARQDLNATRECYAVLLSGDTLSTHVLFWHAGDIEIANVDGQHNGPEEYREGAVALNADEDGRVEFESSERDIVFPQQSAAKDAYLPASDVSRVAWSEPPTGTLEISELEIGSDGCAAFTFVDPYLPRFYFCTPLTELPFVAGDHVGIEDQGDLVILSTVGAPNIQIAATRGRSLPTVSGAVIAAKPDFDVPLGPDPVCGTVAQPQVFSAQFGGKTADFAAGESAEFDDGAHTLTIHGVHAERRLVLDIQCAEGPDDIGDDLELVYVWAETQAP